MASILSKTAGARGETF